MPEKSKRMTRGIARAFDIVRDMVDHPEKYEADAVIIAPDHVAEVFTPERARLYMTMQERGEFASVTELAQALKRDVTRVSRDVAYLEGFGLLHVERAGKGKRVTAVRKPILVA